MAGVDAPDKRAVVHEAQDLLGQLVQRRDPLLRAMNGVGVGALTQIPLYADLAEQPFRGICHLCWAMQERAQLLGDTSNPLLNAMTLIGRDASHEHTHS